MLEPMRDSQENIEEHISGSDSKREILRRKLSKLFLGNGGSNYAIPIRLAKRVRDTLAKAREDRETDGMIDFRATDAFLERG